MRVRALMADASGTPLPGDGPHTPASYLVLLGAGMRSAELKHGIQRNYESLCVQNVVIKTVLAANQLGAVCDENWLLGSD